MITTSKKGAIMPTNNEVLLIDLPSCNGIEGANVFNTQPSSRQAVFDQNEDVLYIITTDRRNVKTGIRRLRYEDYPIPRPEDLYVSKEEFQRSNDEMKGALNNVQLTLQQILAATTANEQSHVDGESKHYQHKSGRNRNGSNARNNGADSAIDANTTTSK